MMENNIENMGENNQTSDQNQQTGSQEEASLLAGKYNSVQALEQGYKELSRLVREKSPEVPEEYQVDFSDMPELADLDLSADPLWQRVTPAMREAGLSQPQAEAVTKAFVGWQAEQAKAEEESFNNMGPEGKAMASQVNRFIEKNFSKDEAGLAHSVASNVDGLKFLHKVATLSGEKPVPENASGAPDGAATLKQKALQMLSDPDLQHNPEKQEAYNRIWKDIEAMTN